jgi:DNA-binding protein WhiA
MSFAAITKKELTLVEIGTHCCRVSELAALIRMNGAVQLTNRKVVLDISTENAAIARRIYSLLKLQFEIHPEILVRKKMRLKKNNVYIVRISQGVQELLQQLSIVREGFTFIPGIAPKLIGDICCKKAYLRGAFLAGGSVNSPEGSSYHLEIASMYEGHSHALCDLVNAFNLNAKCIERKKGYVMYLKEGERIVAFLNLIGAHQALLKFEDVRIVKDMRNSVNRLVNCETANLNKTISASMRQIENIELIKKEMGLENLPDRLREIAELRLQHPDMNLKELGEYLKGKVSKSGVNHRLRKLNEMAEKLRIQ